MDLMEADLVRLPWTLQAHSVDRLGFDPAEFENSV